MKNRTSIMCILSLLVASIFSLSAFAADKGLASKDKEFIKKAASAGMMEVQLGQMAQTKATSQEVKDFAGRMVTDHGKANDELRALAQQKNVTLPTKLESKHKKVVDKMTKASAAEFDKKYVSAMVKDHKEDVSEFKKASKDAKDPELKAWAEKTLPVLEQHLQHAQELSSKIEGTK